MVVSEESGRSSQNCDCSGGISPIESVDLVDRGELGGEEASLLGGLGPCLVLFFFADLSMNLSMVALEYCRLSSRLQVRANMDRRITASCNISTIGCLYKGHKDFRDPGYSVPKTKEKKKECTKAIR